MLDVEIPGIPPARVVVVELEHVSGAAQDLAASLLVPDRRQYAAVVPLDAKKFVFHRPTGDFRWLVDHRPPAWRRSTARVRGRIEDRHAVAVGRDEPGRSLAHRVRGLHA